MYDYCKDWKLEVNVDKTNAMVISRGKIRNKPEFYFGMKKLDIVDDYCYLGIQINFNGKFQKAIKKRLKTMFVLLSRINTLQIPIDISLELFYTLVAPILLYGAEVWGYANIEVIEKVHLQFCRAILKVSKTTPIAMVYGELGRFPLEIQIKIKIIAYWCKIRINLDNKLSNIMFMLI